MASHIRVPYRRCGLWRAGLGPFGSISSIEAVSFWPPEELPRLKFPLESKSDFSHPNKFGDLFRFEMSRIRFFFVLYIEKTQTETSTAMPGQSRARMPSKRPPL